MFRIMPRWVYVLACIFLSIGCTGGDDDVAGEQDVPDVLDTLSEVAVDGGDVGSRDGSDMDSANGQDSADTSSDPVTDTTDTMGSDISSDSGADIAPDIKSVDEIVSSDAGDGGESTDIGGCVDDQACQDENPCTDGVCKKDGTCLQVVLFQADCDDGDACTEGDSCGVDGVCVPGVLWDHDGDGSAPLACGGADCDDGDSLVGPHAVERCNGADDDCDGLEDEVPALPLDCTIANELDADGLCDGTAGDPTGKYASAQVVDLGKGYGDVLLTFTLGGVGVDCDGQGAVDISEDGENWQPLWSGSFSTEHLPVSGSLRYVRGGSDTCEINSFTVDVACMCDAPIITNCNQANAFDDDSCCCFDTFHTLDTGAAHTLTDDEELECCITTGFSCGCTDESLFEVSVDGVAWNEAASLSTTSQKEGGGPGCDQSKGWVSHCISLPLETPFRYIRGTNSSCYVDFFECTISTDCEPKYSCEGEGALDCDDGDSCTLDNCDPNTGCSYAPMCDDGDPCTVDVCGDGACWLDGMKDCDDGVLCTVDSCNPENGLCDHVVQVFGVAECDDDQGCTTDRCEITCGDDGACVHACAYSALECPDNDACEDEACNTATGLCEGTPIECEDGNPCTIESCDSQIGCVFSLRDCDDDNDCTFDSCHAEASFELACVHTAFETNNPECDDSDPCTDDVCSSLTGACSHVQVDCDDGVGCTFDQCDPGSGTCFHDANDAGCDDSIPCTDDGCDSEGGCVHTQRDCDDGNPCTHDACVVATGICIHEAVECDDGDACNGTESCNLQNGQCSPGVPKNCDDGNPCNGSESCSAPSGFCVPGLPIDCDDGLGCNGVESCDPTTGACVAAAAPICPLAEAECKQNGGVAGTVSGGMKSSNLTASIRLRDEDQWEDKAEIIQDLKNHPQLESAQLSTVISDLNREGDRTYVLLTAQCFNAGFSFNTGDDTVLYWYPQGITGTATAYDNGTFYGIPLALVSWYHKPHMDSSTSIDKGARISIINTDDFDDIRYRHALLVEPTRSADGTPNFKQIKSFHAGGIAWYGRYLYVSDTSRGFRVFDMKGIIRVSTGKSNSIGLNSNGKYYAFGYKYVIPQVGRYKLCSESCCARFSFVAVDRTTNPPALVSGAYSDANSQARVHRWILDPDTRKLVVNQGVATPAKLLYPGVKRMQGAVSAYGAYFFSSSQPKTSWYPTPGSLHYGWTGDLETGDHGYPAFPEDLHYSPFSDNIWSLTEQPGLRDVFTVKSAAVLNGCSSSLW